MPRRAETYDEVLELLGALLSGSSVNHVGTHFTADDVRFLPPPVQDELPIWIAARWPNPKPLVRAALHQGVVLIDLDEPADLVAASAALSDHRHGDLDGFDVVVQRPAGDDPEPWVAVGATWWLAAFDPFTVTPMDVRAAIAEKPGPEPTQRH